MAKVFPKFYENYKPTDPRTSTNPEHKRREEKHTKA